MKKFTYASAFAGIGGMTLGLEPLGGIGVVAWEYDPTSKKTQYAQDAHKLLHPEITVYGDICKAEPKELPDFDVFCLTPPCQAFSVAGKRGGFDDTRGTLTFEALRIAKEKKPKILFMENVKGLVNHDKGNTMSTIVHAINEIGYVVDFNVLNSKYFDVAQNRERVYLIAVREDLIEETPWIDIVGNTMLPKAKKRYQQEGAKTFNFEWPKQETVRTRLKDFLEEVVNEKYYLNEEKTMALIANLRDRELERIESIENGIDVRSIYTPDVCKKTQNGNRIGEKNGQAPTLTVSYPHGIIEGLAIKEATKKGYDIAKEGDAVNFQFPDSKTRRGRVGKQMANTLEASNINQGVVERVGNINPSGIGMNGNVYSIDAGLSPTLTTNKGEGIKMLERTDRIIEVGKIKTNRNSSLANSVHSTEGISSTLDTMQGGGREPKILENYFITNGHMDLKGHDPKLTTTGVEYNESKIAEEVHPTLTTELIENPQNGRILKYGGEELLNPTSIDNRCSAIAEFPRYRIRKLTPTECLRLQSVPEWAIEKLKENFSDSRLYKFAGNGLTTNVITAIGEKIVELLEEIDA